MGKDVAYMGKNLAYYMLGRHCATLEAKPELAIDVINAHAVYFGACDQAKKDLLSRYDEIFKPFEKQPKGTLPKMKK